MDVIIKIVSIQGGKFVSKHELVFGQIKGGSKTFLENLKSELGVDKKSKAELLPTNVIKDISVFKEDYILDIKKKISSITGLSIGDQLLFTNQGVLGYDYVIDGVLLLLDPNELLTEYKDGKNTLYKYRGVYQLEDYSYTTICQSVGKGSLIISCLPFGEVFEQQDSNDILQHYYKKFWPFLINEEVFDRSVMANESSSFTKIINIPTSITYGNMYTTKTVSFVNKFVKKAIDIGQLMTEINLSEINARFCHLYKNKNIFKFTTKYKFYKEFDRSALNIFFSFNKVKIIMSIFLSGKVKIITLHNTTNLNYIIGLLRDKIPQVLETLGVHSGELVFENIDITNSYILPITTTIFNGLVEINNLLHPMITDVEKGNDKYTFKLSKNVKAFYNITIINQHTKLTFKADNVFFDDLNFINKVIAFYCLKIAPGSEVNIDFKKINKNKRLQDRDPVGYPKIINFARSCQAKNQPIIFNETEYNLLRPDDQKRAIKYFNFTTEEPAYYICPNCQCPFLAFKELDGRPLPCCQKKSMESMGLKKKKEYEQILKTHVVIKEEVEINSRYETKYGKMPGVGRIIDLPPLFKNWLHKNKIVTPYKLLGVSQSQGLEGIYDTSATSAPAHNLILIKDRSHGDSPLFYLDTNEYNPNYENLLVIDQKIDKEHTFYPLHIIDTKRYNSRGIIDKKLLPMDDPLVKVLLSLKKDSLFAHIKSLYTIVRLHTYENLILYVLLAYKRKYVLLPLNNPILEIQPNNTVLPPDLSLDMPLHLLLEVLNHLNIGVNIDSVILCNSRQMGFISNGLIYHHSPEVIKDQNDIPCLYINYELQDIYQAIFDNREPVLLLKVAPRIYKKEIEHFRNLVLAKENLKKRNELEALWSLSRGQRLYKMYSLVDQEDYFVIKGCGSAEEMLSKDYNFDHKDVKKISLMTKTEFKDKYPYSKSTTEYLFRVISNPLLFRHFLNKGIEIYTKNIIRHDGENIGY